MQWFGKAIGGLIGAFFGPVGSLLGVIIGHQWDQSASGRGGSVREISQLFFETTFEVMGQVAKIDGRVSEDEVRVARRIMHGMRLTDAQVQSAIEHFTRGKSAELSARRAPRARSRGSIGDRGDLARAFVQIQLQAAIGAGHDRRREAAACCGASRARSASAAPSSRRSRRWCAAFERGGAAQSERAEPRGAYRVLGVTPQASDDEVKTAYRRLMNQHHPDKLVVARLAAIDGRRSPSRRRTRSARRTSKSRRSAASSSRAAKRVEAGS